MTSKQIERYRSELIQLLKQPPSQDRLNALLKLAQSVGASIIKMEPTPSVYSQNAITELEIVNGIHYALQTASMINMAETAARSYWIALVASLIALLSAAAAWVAVFVQILGNMKQLYL